MAQIVNKNTFPTVYKDDFSDSDNYYRILFNSGKKLQARELTQAQTIIQNQIRRFGSNIFKDNALIKGGETDVDNNFEFIKLNTSTFTGPADPQTLVGITFTGSTSAVEFKISKVIEAEAGDPLTLYGTYVSTKNSTGDTTQQIRCVADEILTTSASFDDLQVENTATCVGTGCRFMVGEAIVYTKGFFVFTEAQDVVLSKYTNTPSAEVGYKRIEQTISADDDVQLYDNQGSEPNISAPGADRYKISLTLVDKATLAASDNFIPRATIRDGGIVSSVQIVNSYNVPNEVMATRIFENSGDYLVKPFNLTYTEDSQDTHLLANITDGVAVIQGYRASQNVSKPSIRVQKSTNTISFDDQLVAAPYANYFEADSVSGLLPKLTPSAGGGYDSCTLFSAADAGGNAIGSAFIRSTFEDGSVQRFYALKLNLATGSNLADIKSVGVNGTTYFNVNDNSQANGPFNPTTQINSLVFPLPNPRPSDVSNADYTVQRQEEFTPAGTSYTISVTGSEELVDDTRWLVTNANTSTEASTFTVSNSGTSATIGNLDIGVLTRVNYYVRKVNVAERGKVKTEVNEVRLIESDGLGFKFINLHKPDICEVTHIEAADDSDRSYAGLFSVDNGQRDNYYDNGKFILEGPQADSMFDPTIGVRCRYSYFEHQDAGQLTKGFFSRNSYSGQVSYDKIPRHTFADGRTISLANVLDFRPTVDSDGKFQINNGASINELPIPNGVIDLDVSYFVPRIDRISMDKNGVINYLQGKSNPNPVAPATPDGSLHLFDVFLNANTLNPGDLSIRKIDHKRYTMSQINVLEKRLGRLEQLTTLSLLETKADTLLVLDDAGDIRLKSGFVVDNFKSHAFSRVDLKDYRASIDLASGILWPRKWEGTVDLTYDSAVNNPSGNPMQIMGGFIVPKFDREIYLENEYASNTMLVNPFQVNSYTGSMELYPASDTWYETSYTANPSVSFQGSEIATDGSYKWNDHEWNWKGVSLDDLQSGDTTNKKDTVSGNTTTTSWNVVENVQTVQTYIGDTLVSATHIPKMRSKKIRFRITGMRPNAKLFAFFDGVSVDAWVKNETFGSGTSYQNLHNSDPDFGSQYLAATEYPTAIGGPPTQLESDDDGIVEGSFFIPAGTLKFETGTKKFEVRDVSGQNNEENALSRATANFASTGILNTYQKNYTSTRIIHIEQDQSIYTKPQSGGDGSDGGQWSQPPNIGGSLPSGGDGPDNSNWGSATVYTSTITEYELAAFGGPQEDYYNSGGNIGNWTSTSNPVSDYEYEAYGSGGISDWSGWSDIRLKNNIEFSHLFEDLPLYKFTYVWDNTKKYLGVMAQDILQTKYADAVTEEGGYYRVDYSKLPVDMEEI